MQYLARYVLLGIDAVGIALLSIDDKPPPKHVVELTAQLPAQAPT